MYAGHSWQCEFAKSKLHVALATAYRLRQLARDEQKAASAFLDDRHGHPYKLTDKVASLDQRVLHDRSADSFEQDAEGIEKPMWSSRQCHPDQPAPSKVGSKKHRP